MKAYRVQNTLFEIFIEIVLFILMLVWIGLIFYAIITTIDEFYYDSSFILMSLTGVIFIVGMLFCIGNEVMSEFRYILCSKYGYEDTGTVVDKKVKNVKNGTWYYLIIEYTGKNGNTYRSKAAVSLDDYACKVGNTVLILVYKKYAMVFKTENL